MDSKPPAPDPAAEFEAEFIAGLESEDDFAARELLAEGWPVYYVEDDTPAGLVVKEHPDGRRQWVRGDTEQVVRNL
jgi:hypothetical protein